MILVDRLRRPACPRCGQPLMYAREFNRRSLKVARYTFKCSICGDQEYIIFPGLWEGTWSSRGPHAV